MYKSWVNHSGETHQSCCCCCQTAGGDHDKLVYYLQYSIRSFVNLCDAWSITDHNSYFYLHSITLAALMGIKNILSEAFPHFKRHLPILCCFDMRAQMYFTNVSCLYSQWFGWPLTQPPCVIPDENVAARRRSLRWCDSRAYKLQRDGLKMPESIGEMSW